MTTRRAAIVQKLFFRTDLGFSDIDLVEPNEAFAVQVLFEAV